MIPNSYDIGNIIRVAVAFTDIAGAFADPTGIQLNVRVFGGDIETFTYADSQIVKDAVGKYHYDYTPSVSGKYYYRFIGSGAIIAAADSQFVISDSPAL